MVPQIYVPTESSLTYRQFRSCASCVEVLIGGQSDVKSAIVPMGLHPHAFNFADTGEGSIESYFKFRTILADTPNVRLFVYALSLPQFVGVRAERLYSRVFRRGYVGPADYPALRAIGVRAPRVRKLRAMMEVTGRAELAVMRANVADAMRGRPTRGLLKGDLVRGFRRQQGSFVDEARAKEIAAHHFAEGGEVIDEVMVSYFHKLLQLFADRGIPVVTVAPPVTDVYRRAAERYVTMDQIVAATVDAPEFDGLIARHIDLTTTFERSHHYFRDQNHMNEAGAEATTRIVASEIADLLTASPARR